MKYNLILSGIPHSDGHEENTDVVLGDFLNSELGFLMLTKYRFKTFTDWARDRTERKEVLLPYSPVIITMRGYERQPPKNSKTNQHFLSISNIHVKCPGLTPIQNYWPNETFQNSNFEFARYSLVFPDVIKLYHLLFCHAYSAFDIFSACSMRCFN